MVLSSSVVVDQRHEDEIFAAVVLHTVPLAWLDRADVAGVDQCLGLVVVDKGAFARKNVVGLRFVDVLVPADSGPRRQDDLGVHSAVAEELVFAYDVVAVGFADAAGHIFDDFAFFVLNHLPLLCCMRDACFIPLL